MGVYVAFGDDWDVESPTWTQLDTGTPHYVVQSWSIDRGRQSEIDKTSTGEAQIFIRDWSGAFDPTYASGAFFGNLDPMKQVKITLTNPVTSAESTLFRGFVSKWTFKLHQTKRFLDVIIDCVDGLEYLANAELVTDVHGETVPSGSEGDIYYLRGSLEHPTDNQCEDRINAALDDAGWPSGLRSVFTGNVAVKPNVYSPRNQFLNVIDDAADAEFPGVANRYIDKDGNFTFHGRLARFNPEDEQYGITTWNVGDDASGQTPLSAGDDEFSFQWERDVNDIVNSVYSAPQGIADDDIADQRVEDATSVGKYGLRSLSFENLLTEHGYLLDYDELQETVAFAQYYCDNKANPANRLSSLFFRSRDKGDSEAAAVWALLCGIDISDICNVRVSTAWGGAFNEDYFVEGVHYECHPGSNRQPIVDLTVDVSPRLYYDTNEWSV